MLSVNGIWQNSPDSNSKLHPFQSYSFKKWILLQHLPFLKKKSCLCCLSCETLSLSLTLSLYPLSLYQSLSLIIRRLHYMNTGTRHYLNNVDWYFGPGIGFNIEIHQIKSKYLLPDFVVEKQVDSSDNNRILNIHGHKSLQRIPGEKLKEPCPF